MTVIVDPKYDGETDYDKKIINYTPTDCGGASHSIANDDANYAISILQLNTIHRPQDNFVSIVKDLKIASFKIVKYRSYPIMFDIVKSSYFHSFCHSFRFQKGRTFFTKHDILSWNSVKRM